MLPHTARFRAFNVFRKQKFCQFKKISQKIFRPIRNVIRIIVEEIRYILLITALANFNFVENSLCRLKINLILQN